MPLACLSLETSRVINFKFSDNPDDLEDYLEQLLEEKKIFDDIETRSKFSVDSGDIHNAFALLVQEIERTQKRVQKLKEKQLNVSGDEEVEEEEEEIDSSSSKYNIEHVIRDDKGKLRRVQPEDLDIEKHKGVRNAFKVLYEIQKEYSIKDYGEGGK